MAVSETCGLKTTNEEIEVYVALADDGYLDVNNNCKWVDDGKRIVGIYNSLSDLKRGKKWNKHIKYCEKCKLSIEKIEDVEM